MAAAANNNEREREREREREHGDVVGAAAAAAAAVMDMRPNPLAAAGDASAFSSSLDAVTLVTRLVMEVALAQRDLPEKGQGPARASRVRANMRSLVLARGHEVVDAIERDPMANAVLNSHAILSLVLRALEGTPLPALPSSGSRADQLAFSLREYLEANLALDPFAASAASAASAAHTVRAVDGFSGDQLLAFHSAVVEAVRTYRGMMRAAEATSALLRCCLGFFAASRR